MGIVSLRVDFEAISHVLLKLIANSNAACSAGQDPFIRSP